MLRAFVGIKWGLSGIVFLIMLSIGCVLWYRYDTTPYKRDAANTKKIVQQRENTKRVYIDNLTDNRTNIPSESRLSSAEKPSTETTELVSEIGAGNVSIQDGEASIQETEKFLPNGFGPYPHVPKDYFRRPSWLRYSNYIGKSNQEATAFEIMDRVLIKLWNQGQS